MCPLTKGCGLGIQKCHHSSSRTQIPRNRLQGRLWVFQWSHGAMGPMVPWSMCPLIQGCELYVQQCHQSSSRTRKPQNQLQLRGNFSHLGQNLLNGTLPWVRVIQGKSQDGQRKLMICTCLDRGHLGTTYHQKLRCSLFRFKTYCQKSAKKAVFLWRN